MFNPLYLLAPPVLIVASLPLVALAVLTTSLAVITLLIRVSIVYFELGVALIHSWLFATNHVSTSDKHRSLASSGYSTPTRHHRRRRSSAASLLAADQSMSRRPPTKSESFASLVSTAGPNRDFEGIGGWRMPGDGEEEALWIGMNSRLELPTALPDKHRRHQRSLTGGSQRWSWSPEAIRMSPVQSRSRTPNAPECPGSPDEYFTMHHYRKMGSSWEALAIKSQDALPPLWLDKVSFEELRIGGYIDESRGGFNNELARQPNNIHPLFSRVRQPEVQIKIEPFFMEQRRCELGRAWESYVFGGHVDGIGDGLNMQFGVSVTKWPHPFSEEGEARAPSRRAYKTSYAVPMAWVEELWRAEFWNQIDNGDNVDFRIPKILGLRKATSVEWTQEDEEWENFSDTDDSELAGLANSERAEAVEKRMRIRIRQHLGLQGVYSDSEDSSVARDGDSNGVIRDGGWRQ
ncbi:hypothetical protein UCRNP2_7836 [Neofusicoccum parvum UCRNP2]|uniref:Uncharacterized protein n=1 Tax=Botryosphaeria parva (strain UCR-NP2) TaxID=1287680 RepID=R1G1Z6_BOTPV|nr:hypothetical protein UCRNP2_7836 [Neofusicoccum parvum UCRNP2]